MTSHPKEQAKISDRQRWDERYRHGAYADRLWPSAYLQQLADAGVVNGPGRALDVACGRGRNSLFLAARGFQVDAVDVAAVAIAQAASSAVSQNLRINWQCRDLDTTQALPVTGAYSLIVMFRFVAPKLLPSLLDGLTAGGLLVIEEHLQWSQTDTLVGPSSQRFRVAPGEIHQQLSQTGVEFDVVDQYEGLVKEATDLGSDGTAAVSRLCIRRRSS